MGGRIGIVTGAKANRCVGSCELGIAGSGAIARGEAKCGAHCMGPIDKEVSHAYSMSMGNDNSICLRDFMREDGIQFGYYGYSYVR